jgi:uncharacterized membrane protein
MQRQSNLLGTISMGLSSLGILVSGYLTWTHFTNTSILCIGSNGCDIVQQSVYSTIQGLPVALFGVLGYAVILALLLVQDKGEHGTSYAPLAIFGLTLIGVAYSAYLTYLELFVIHSLCEYCVASAIIMVALFGIAVYRLMAPADA